MLLNSTQHIARDGLFCKFMEVQILMLFPLIIVLYINYIDTRNECGAEEKDM
jgi:hypothetical protein